MVNFRPKYLADKSKSKRGKVSPIHMGCRGKCSSMIILKINKENTLVSATENSGMILEKRKERGEEGKRKKTKGQEKENHMSAACTKPIP